MRKNVLEYLESSARMHADKPAFCDENRVFTFGELLKAAQGLGTHLAGAVDTLHKPVAVLIGRTAESVAAMQGGQPQAGRAACRLCPAHLDGRGLCSTG